MFQILEYCTVERLDEREQHYLDVYMPKSICYNLAPEVGTTRGKPCNEETKAKIGNANRGRIVSAETRQKISESGRGRIFSDEHRSKIGAANRRREYKALSLERRTQISNLFKGVKQSPEHITKRSKSLMGHVVTSETRTKIGMANKGKTKGVRQPIDLVERRAAKTRKSWILISPDGTEYEVCGLTKFCQEHDLIPSGMSNVAAGRATNHKGWKCRKAQ